MKHIYKTVDLVNTGAFKQAEKLKNAGWKIINVGLSRILFEKPKPLARGLKH